MIVEFRRPLRNLKTYGDLTRPQRQILCLIAKNPNISFAEISDASGLRYIRVRRECLEMADSDIALVRLIGEWEVPDNAYLTDAGKAMHAEILENS
jgi:hypothetical protein